MESSGSKRVGIFLAHWELISVLSNTIKMLNDQAVVERRGMLEVNV